MPDWQLMWRPVLGGVVLLGGVYLVGSWLWQTAAPRVRGWMANRKNDGPGVDRMDLAVEAYRVLHPMVDGEARTALETVVWPAIGTLDGGDE